MDNNNKTKENTRIIKFKDKSYLSFNDFYSNNKDKIYLEILKTFEEIIEKEMDYMYLDFVVKFGDFTFEPSVKYGIKNGTKKFNVFKKHFMDYFKDKEEYELCDRVKKLSDKIKTH